MVAENNERMDMSYCNFRWQYQLQWLDFLCGRSQGNLYHRSMAMKWSALIIKETARLMEVIPFEIAIKVMLEKIHQNQMESSVDSRFSFFNLR